MVRFDLELFLFKLSHDLAFELLALKFDVFASEVFLLEQSEIFGLPELADLLSDFAIGLGCELLSESVDLPLVRFVDFFNLFCLAALQSLTDDLEF